jgi:hypothetical protein
LPFNKEVSPLFIGIFRDFYAYLEHILLQVKMGWQFNASFIIYGFDLHMQLLGAG